MYWKLQRCMSAGAESICASVSLLLSLNDCNVLLTFGWVQVLYFTVFSWLVKVMTSNRSRSWRIWASVLLWKHIWSCRWIMDKYSNEVTSKNEHTQHVLGMQSHHLGSAFWLLDDPKSEVSLEGKGCQYQTYWKCLCCYSSKRVSVDRVCRTVDWNSSCLFPFLVPKWSAVHADVLHILFQNLASFYL